MNSFSIYIPRLNSNVTEDYIKYAFRTKNVGEVARVDFTPIGKKPGFIEVVTSLKSAFVHFSFFTNISQDPEFGNKLREGNGYKFYPGRIEEGYWLLLPAKNPIQQTMMNNSQIVENSRFLEAKLVEQAATIKAMEEKLEGLQKVVYQLLGGLFNQGSQNSILSNHLNTLFNTNDRRANEENTSKWAIWPTTRQGDENADRIAALEAQVQAMTFFNIEEPMFHSYDVDSDEKQDEELLLRKNMNQDNESVSTHSSMPDLIGDSDSDDDNSSMPDLESISSAGSELCGNE
jgi:hypothetical protein